MNMDEELREHLILSLHHLAFARELLRRTGFVDELDEMGWAYGANPNGYFEVEAYDFQLNALLSLLTTELTGNVHFLSGDSEQWENWIRLSTLASLPETERFDLAVSIEIRGEERVVRKWQHFVHWFQPEAEFLTDITMTEANFVWVLWEPDVLDIMMAWETLLTTWEVSHFYEHVADARAWKEGRRSTGIDDGTKRLSTTRSDDEGCDVLPDGGLASTAGTPRPIGGRNGASASKAAPTCDSRTA